MVRLSRQAAVDNMGEVGLALHLGTPDRNGPLPLFVDMIGPDRRLSSPKNEQIVTPAIEYHATEIRDNQTFRHNQTWRRNVIRKAKAVWHGTGRAGTGALSSDSGVLANTPYSFKTRFENEKGTNPEELIAAAHAGCFTMALAFQLQGAGFTPTELSTEAAVTIEQAGQGFAIKKSALTLRAQVPNIDQATFDKLAKDAEKNCPVSRVLNAEITLDAKLG